MVLHRERGKSGGMAPLEEIACGVVRWRLSVRRAAPVAGRWKRAPRLVPDNSRGADETLLGSVDSDSRPEERPV